MTYIHNINPIIFSIGPLDIRWYGLMYVIGFSLGYVYLLKSDFVRKKNFSTEEIENVLFYGVLGVILGSRLGYFLLYRFESLLSNPLEFFYVWHGGMTIHGGIIGVAIAVYLFCKKYKRSFLEVSDIIVVPATLGLAFGRIGNFINGELWGRPTDQSWGVLFPLADDQLRHPSQIYSAIKQLTICGSLYMATRYNPPIGFVSFLFAFLYGIMRIIVEEVWREPLDGYIFGITTAQMYCIPLILFGLGGLVYLYRKSKAS